MSLPKSLKRRYQSYLNRINKYTPDITPMTPSEFHEDWKKKNAIAVARSLRQAGPLVNAYRCWKSQNPEQNTKTFTEWKEWRKTLPKDSRGNVNSIVSRQTSHYEKWLLHKSFLKDNLGNKKFSLTEIAKLTGLANSELSRARCLEELPYSLGRLKKHTY